MAGYDRIPGIDASYDFPPQVRQAIASSSEVAAKVNASVTARVPAEVSSALADDDTVINAAVEAVTDVTQSLDVVLGGDGRALPVTPNGTSGWTLLPESTGYIAAFIVDAGSAGAYIPFGIKLNGDLVGRFPGSNSETSTTVFAKIRDAIQEWWVGPILQRFRGWTATVGLGNKGEVLAIDIPDRGSPTVVQIGTATVDDHNVPARYTIPGRGSISQWTHHGATTNLFIRVANGNGTALDYLNASEILIEIGSGTSYGQWHRLEHKITANTDTFWCLLRNGGNWGIAEILVNWPNKTAVMNVSYKRLVSFSAQPYVYSTDGRKNSLGNQTIRLGLGYNPTANRHEIYLGELDLVTGIFTDLANPSVTHNINGSTYLSDSDLTPVIPDTTGTRRFLGVSPLTDENVWNILTVEYTTTTHNPSGVIHEYNFNPTSKVTTDVRTLGVVGAHMARYPAGASYAEDGTVWHSNESGGTWTLSHENSAVYRSNRALMRPMPASADSPFDVLVSEVGYYPSYLDWGDTNLLALSKDS